MAWSDLTITRDLLDSMEGETLEGYSNTSTLLIADNDDERISLAKRKLKLDVLNASSKSVISGDFTQDTLLDAMEVADTEGLLEDLLAYYFLSLLFQDASINVRGRGTEKHKYYYMLYMQNLTNTVTVLLSKLTPPQEIRRFRIVHGFG